MLPIVTESATKLYTLNARDDLSSFYQNNISYTQDMTKKVSNVINKGIYYLDIT